MNGILVGVCIALLLVAAILLIRLARGATVGMIVVTGALLL